MVKARGDTEYRISEQYDYIKDILEAEVRRKKARHISIRLVLKVLPQFSGL